MAGFFFFPLLQTLFKYLCCTRVWYADHFSELSGNLCPFQGEQGRGCTSGLRGKTCVLKALSALSEVPHFHSILILNLCLSPVWRNRIFIFFSVLMALCSQVYQRLKTSIFVTCYQKFLLYNVWILNHLKIGFDSLEWIF